MSFLLFVLLILLHGVLGMSLMLVIKKPLSSLHVALAIPLATGVTSLLFFVLNSAHLVPLSPVVFFVGTTALLVITSWYSQISLVQITHVLRTLWQQAKQDHPLVQTGGIFLCLITLITLWSNIVWPISDWDAFAHYAFRAKVVAEAQDIGAGRDMVYFYAYPFYTSMLHVYSYVLGVPQAKIWYSLLFASFLIGFAFFTRRVVSRSWTIGLTVLLAVNPLFFEHATMAYTNLAYTLFFTLGFFWLWHWQKTGDPGDLLGGSLCVGFSCWTRFAEPFWLSAVVLLVTHFVWQAVRSRRYYFESIYGLMVIVGIRATWQEYRKVVGDLLPATSESLSLTSGFLFQLRHASVGEIWQHIQAVAIYMYTYVFPIIWPYSLPLLIMSVQLVRYRAWKQIWLGCLMLVNLAAIFAGTFVFSFVDQSWMNIGGSAQRMSLFLLPCSLYFLAEAIGFLSQKLGGKEGE